MELNQSDKIASHRKENGFYRQLTALDPKDGSPVVTARFYWPGRDGASNCYCCVWVYGDDVHGSGAGKAGGYGYHKESQALALAFDDAGLTLADDLAGRGSGAMRDAMKDVAKQVTSRRKFFITEAHA
jgi:hypothetical protein